MDLYQNPKNYFSENEFNLGDSAFSNSPFMVLSFKKQSGEEIPEEHERFNKLLSKVRMRSEHTIGILKGRFPWLRSIRMKITKKKRSLYRLYYGRQTDPQRHPDVSNQHAERRRAILDFEVILQFRSRLISLFL